MRWDKRRRYIKEHLIEELKEDITKPPSPKIIVTPEEMEVLLEVTKEDKMMRAVVVFGG